jgi:hypothetical protein
MKPAKAIKENLIKSSDYSMSDVIICDYRLIGLDFHYDVSNLFLNGVSSLIR